MNEFNAMPQEAHRLELVGRERLTVSGVEDVERFDETGIVMSTSAGTLVITGEELHIGKLSLDGGGIIRYIYGTPTRYSTRSPTSAARKTAGWL